MPPSIDLFLETMMLTKKLTFFFGEKNKILENRRISRDSLKSTQNMQDMENMGEAGRSGTNGLKKFKIANLALIKPNQKILSPVKSCKTKSM